MLDNCFGFAPRDSIPGVISKICKYLKDHPGWSEDELEEQINKFISADGVESFNGRIGNVILDKNDVNNLKIASAYFSEGDESIDSLDLVSLYNQGVRFVFTDFNSVTSGYNLAFVLDYFDASGEVVYYPVSTASGGGGNIVSVNGKTGEVRLKVVDVSNGNSSDENAYIFIDESEDYPDVISPDSSKLGGQLPSYYASAEEVSQLKTDLGNFKNDVNKNMSFFNKFDDFNESVGLVRIDSGIAYIDSSFNRYKTITINAVSGQEFEFIGSVNGAINYLVVTTDASGKVIEKYNQGVNGVVSQKTQVISVDDNIKKIYFCFWKDSGYSLRKKDLVNIKDFENQVKSYTDTKYTEAITYADNAIVKDTKNKNIVFFGTSIPAGTVNIDGVNQSIPSYIGELLHANVINESLGSSMARLGWNSSKTENDPYGWTNRAWQNVFRAMGATIEEKRDLIENYETKWRDLIGGDFEGSSGDGSGTGKPITLTSEMKSDILSWSYENKLIPYLDGTKIMPDLFIFEHGHNDYAPDMSGIPSTNPDDINGYNRSLYSDIMAFYFRLIWEANPQAQILIVSHYANDTTKSKRIFEAQKECAEHNKVWFCNIADNIGWSQQKVTVNGILKTRLEHCLPDALHPSTDISGNAVKREARIIANYIKAFIF